LRDTVVVFWLLKKAEESNTSDWPHRLWDSGICHRRSTFAAAGIFHGGIRCCASIRQWLL